MPSFCPITGAARVAAYHRSKATVASGNGSTATAAPGDYVEIHYVGTLDDGTEFDSSRSRGEPLSFTIGAGKVVPGFEQIVSGMAVGEQRKERIEPALAYGDWTDAMTAQVPVANAPKGLEPGSTVQLQNGMPAQVTAVDDKFVTIDANHPLAGKALTFDVELVKLVPVSRSELATFGAGCFWGVELRFQRLPGVLTTEVGYCNGHVKGVTYEQVCQGDSGHAEVVQLRFDPDEVSYERLVEFFFENHDATTLNRQGADVGTQYRSGIYTHSEEQRQVADRVLARMQQKFSGQVVTEVEPIDNYNPAEEYHQQYLEKGGRFGRPQSAKKMCNDPVRCYG